MRPAAAGVGAAGSAAARAARRRIGQAGEPTRAGTPPPAWSVMGGSVGEATPPPDASAGQAGGRARPLGGAAPGEGQCSQ